MKLQTNALRKPRVLAVLSLVLVATTVGASVFARSLTTNGPPPASYVVNPAGLTPTPASFPVHPKLTPFLTVVPLHVDRTIDLSPSTASNQKGEIIVRRGDGTVVAYRTGPDTTIQDLAIKPGDEILYDISPPTLRGVAPSG